MWPTSPHSKQALFTQAFIQQGCDTWWIKQALGLFCCELTYQYMPLAGLYFNGSVARAIVSSESAAKVIAAEAGKDETFSGRFGQVPLFVITEDNAALYGCARYAQSRV